MAIATLRDARFERDCRLHGLKMIQKNAEVMPGIVPTAEELNTVGVSVAIGEQRYG